jgi:hypothetical protein
LKLNSILALKLIHLDDNGVDDVKEAIMMKHGNRFFFKACPKCKGDMYLDSDAYGAYRKCLQCGRIFEIETSPTGIAKAGKDKLAA